MTTHVPEDGVVVTLVDLPAREEVPALISRALLHLDGGLALATPDGCRLTGHLGVPVTVDDAAAGATANQSADVAGAVDGSGSVGPVDSQEAAVHPASQSTDVIGATDQRLAVTVCNDRRGAVIAHQPACAPTAFHNATGKGVDDTSRRVRAADQSPGIRP